MFPEGIFRLLFALLMLAGIVLFVLRILPKWQMLRRAAPENRFDQTGERIRRTLLHVFGQKRILSDPATGLMHAFIFWGFCVLGVHTTSIFLAGLTGFELEHALGPWYSWCKDAVVVLVALAILYAVFRRAVLRPARVESSGEAYLVLGMILTLMLTDAGMAAASFNLEPARMAGFGFLGSMLGPSFSGFSPDALRTLFTVCFWIQAAGVLTFLNILPGSKHFHVITSLPNVYFQKLTPMGKLRSLDLEDENAESFGVSRAEEMDWKQMLDLYSCTECGRCHENCPTHTTGKPLSPKHMNDHLKAFAYSNEKALACGKSADLPSLYESEAVTEDELWACTTCGYCERACPLFIEQIQWIADFRRYKVLTESEFPEELQKAYKGLENNSNPWNIGSHKRGEWAEELGVPVVGSDEAEGFEWLFFVGCSGSFDDRNRKISESFVKLLQAAGVKFAILGEAEGCCGDPARRSGNEYLFQELAKANIEMFKEAGVTKIVSTCPHCFNTLKNEYPEMEGTFEVVHHSELLARLVSEGKLRPTKSLPGSVTFHDSCYLGRYNEIYDQPRAILSAIPGARIQEMDLHHEKGFCCGGGGGRIFMEETLGTRINHSRIEQVQKTGATTVCSACPFCMTMLTDGVKEKEIENVQVKDIAEVLVETL